MLKTTGYSDVDFDRDGKQVGYFNLPLSAEGDGWGVIPIPLTVVKNGSGPTIILEGGNHGDEYEGPITLCELIRELDPSEIQGRLIIVPAIHQPAVVAGMRTSPVDGLNMNRTFPGDPLGTTTRQIASYVNDVLFPLADVFVDLHSGGSSARIIPSAAIEPADDPAHLKRNIDAAIAFGAPMVVVINNGGDPRTSTASAVRAGLTVVGTEMGGGGGVSHEGLAVCRRGVRNLLAHFGVLPAKAKEPPRTRPPLFTVSGTGKLVFATHDGVLEPFHECGTAVSAGQPAARIHFLTDPGRTPTTLHYAADGIVYAVRQPGRVRPGNCCLVVAAPYEEPAG